MTSSSSPFDDCVFAAVWDAIVERGVVEGVADVHVKRRVRTLKPPSNERPSDADSIDHSL